jgi:hypothetical protein
MSDRRWTLNETEVAAKVIDGEAIILNLSTGLYYSLDGIGAKVWEMLVANRSLEQIVDTLAQAYTESAQRIEADVEQLVSDLEGEHLIVTANGAAPMTEASPAPEGEAAGYVSPALVKHTDMADLLALDPPMPGLMDGPWTDSGQV